ncbi:unnamed protein product [Rhodiola kirilowii]
MNQGGEQAEENEEFDLGIFNQDDGAANADDQGSTGPEGNSQTHQSGGDDQVSLHDPSLHSENDDNEATVDGVQGVPAPGVQGVPAPIIDDNVVDAPAHINVPDIRNYVLVRDREPRIRIPVKRYANFVADSDSAHADFTECDSHVGHAGIVEFAFLAVDIVKQNVPETFTQATNSANATEWWKSMHDEIDSMKQNGTWELVPKPPKARVINCKWIYKLKDGLKPSDPLRYKSRLVAKGFSQKEGIDYNDIFAPVVKYKTLRLMIAMTAVFNWHLEQMDV